MRIVPSLLCVAALGCTSSSDPAPAEAKPAEPTQAQKAAPAAPAKPEAAADPVAQAEAPKGEPGVRFVNVKDGDTIPNGFELAFEVVGKAVSPAGEPIDDTTRGHHHLIIDAPGIKAGTPVPADASHIHFGKGQSKHVLNVAPGQHTLTLQFADGAHRSYGPEWATSITVTVTAATE